MIEVHPFGNFIPRKSKYLLLGSFVTKPMPGYEWFYANGRNQFWPILEKVYRKTLNTKKKQQELFVDLQMALADIISSCKRVNNCNLDMNLTDIVYNESVGQIVRENNIEKIYFTSRFVEDNFRRHFGEVAEVFDEESLIYLPSPFPRNATMRIAEKVKKYREVLPLLD